MSAAAGDIWLGLHAKTVDRTQIEAIATDTLGIGLRQTRLMATFA